MAAPLITMCPTWGQRDVSQRSAALFSSPEAPRRSPLQDRWAEPCHVAILTAGGLGDCTSEWGGSATQNGAGAASGRKMGRCHAPWPEDTCRLLTRRAPGPPFRRHACTAWTGNAAPTGRDRLGLDALTKSLIHIVSI